MSELQSTLSITFLVGLEWITFDEVYAKYIIHFLGFFQSFNPQLILNQQ